MEKEKYFFNHDILDIDYPASFSSEQISEKYLALKYESRMRIQSLKIKSENNFVVRGVM